MRILYINHYAGSKLHGMEFRPFYLAQEWQSQGHKVQVVGGSFSHLRQINPTGKGLIWVEEVEGISYVWIKTLTYFGNGIARLLSIFQFVIMLFFFSIKFSKFKPDVVVASSTYPLDVFPAKFIAFLSDAKVIHEVHDLWPLTLTEIGGLSKWNPFVVLLQIAENYSYKSVDRVVSMLETAFPYMEKHGLDIKRFVAIPNGVVQGDWESGVVVNQSTQEKIDEVRLSGNQIIGYCGGMGIANSVPLLVEAMKAIRDEPISLILVGDGPDRSLLQKVVESEKLENIHFLGSIPKAEIPSFLSQVDLTFIGAPNSSLYKFGVSPNKLLDYLMAGKPVVYAIESGNNWVEQSGCGFSVKSEDPSEIASAIKLFLSMSLNDRIEMGHKGRRFVLDHYLYSDLAARFLQGI